MKSRLLAAFLSLICLSFYAFASAPLQFQNTAEEQRFQALAKELRCLVCQNENLADSNAGLAKDLREEIHKLMQSGKTDDEIKTYLTARYGDFVLYDPPLRAGTLLLWLGPGLLLLVGAITVIIIVRRRKPAALTALQNEEDW